MDVEEPWIEDAESDEDRNRSGEDEDNDDAYVGYDLFSSNQTDPTDVFQVNLEGGMTLMLNGIKAKYPHLLNSTGLTLWKGSEALCDYLCIHPEIVRGKNVVELGAGLGLCGIVAHRQGAKNIVLTDGDTETLTNMRKNVGLNLTDSHKSNSNLAITCKQLLWGKNIEAFCGKWTSNGGGFDVVMGGDIAYAQESLKVLFDTVVGLISSKKGSILLLSYVFRRGVTMESVMECAKQHGLHCKEVQKQSEKSDDGIYIFSR